MHLVADVAVAALLVAAYRDVRRSSPILAWICLAGLLTRLLGSVALYWISAANVAALSHLHSGDGFWQLAPDARSYYVDAKIAAADGLSTVDDWRGSAEFVRILAVWLRIVGTHPLSAVALNTLLYAGVMMMLGRARLRAPSFDTVITRAAIILSFAPLFLIHMTQPLKDLVFAVPVLAATATLPLWLEAFTGGSSKLRAVVGIAIWIVAFYVIGGVRSYYGVMMWCALVVALVVVGTRLETRRLAGYAAGSLLVLSLCWYAHNRAAGFGYINPIAGIVGQWSPAVGHFLDSDVAGGSGIGGSAHAAARAAVGGMAEARERFENSGGDTNVIVVRTSTLQFPLATTIKAVAIGFELIFIPASLLKTVGLVELQGGRGLLVLADIDTVFMDIMLVLFMFALAKHRHALRSNLAVSIYAFTLSGVTYVLLAYVVSNYGTLVRLRMMAAFPILGLCLVPLASRVARPDPEPAAVGVNAN